MRKLFVTILAAAFVLGFSLMANAASIGGAETQGKGKFAIGLDQEVIFDKDGKAINETETDGTITEEWNIKTEIDKMYRTMAKVSYGLLDYLDIYVRLGVAKPDYEEKVEGTWLDSEGVAPEDEGTFTGAGTFKGDSGFAYAFGMKATYPLENDWLIGCDLQYLRHKNDYETSGTLAIYDSEGTLIGEDNADWKGEITFYEWHIAPYIAKKIGNFVPYLGVRYSDARIEDKEEGGSTTNKIKADDNFGVFFGTDYSIDDHWKLNLEGRFIDETAMSLGATYKF